MAGNSEMIEIASKEEFRELQRLNKELEKMVTGVNNVNNAAKNLKIPSEFRNAISQLNDVMKQSNALLRAQLALQQQLATTTNTVTASVTANERAERERIRTERERLRLTEDQRRASERQTQQTAREERAAALLGSAYIQLSRQHAAAARTLQDLIVRGRTAEQTQREYNTELRNAQRQFDSLNARVLAADRAVGRFNRNVGNYPAQAARGLKDLLMAFGVVGGVTAFAAIAKDIFTTTKELQSLNLAMRQVIGTQEGFAESQEFLARISEAYGIEIMGLQKSYTGFFAASQNAIAEGKITASQIQDIFESVSKASGAMGLSVDQQQGAFLALQQMISKGNVQAEEIRGQLAERLPGAFGILAKSMGVTEIELNKLLKDGKVLATDVLPAFARELEKAYGVENLTRVESLAAATTRFGNAWTELVAEISNGDSALTKFLVKSVDVFKKVLQGVSDLTKTEEERRRALDKDIENSAYQNELEALRELAKEKKEYAEQSAKSIQTDTPLRLKEIRAESSAIYDNIRALEAKLEAEGNILGMDAFSPIQSNIDKENEKWDRLNNVTLAYLGSLRAADEFLKKSDLAPKDYTGGTGKTKKQKADIDYLKEVYNQLKQNTEYEIEGNERIMNNEEKNYDVRLKAANDYYNLKAQLLALELGEQQRLNDLTYEQQKEQYKLAASEGKASSDNLDQLYRQYILRKSLIDTKYEQDKSNLAIDSALKLKGVLDAIDDQRRVNIVDEEQLDNLRQLNLELNNLTADSSYGKFKELEERKTAIAEDNAEQRIQIELQRTRAQIDALKGDEKNSKAYQDLRNKEIKLQSDLANAEQTRLEKTVALTLELKTATDEYLKGFSSGILGDFGLSSLEKFLQVGTDGLTEFDRLFEGAGDNINKKFAVVFTAITEVAQEAFNLLNQNSKQNLENSLSEIDMQQRLAEKFALTEEAKQQIQDQADEKRREARRKEAEQQKEIAIFNAIINTAQGVAAAYAQGPLGIPLAIIIGALGAAQIALIAGQQIPEFKEGVRGFEGGLAIVGDGGRSEVVTTPDGGMWRTPSSSTLVDLPKGANVFKSDLDFIRNSGMLMGGLPNYSPDGGLSESGMRRIMSEALLGSATTNISIDKRGVSAYALTVAGKQQSFNNKVSFRGRSFN